MNRLTIRQITSKEMSLFNTETHLTLSNVAKGMVDSFYFWNWLSLFSVVGIFLFFLVTRIIKTMYYCSAVVAEAGVLHI